MTACRRVRVLAVGAVLGLTAGAGCGGGDTAGSDTTAPADDVVDETFSRHVVLEISGAATVTFEGTVDVRIVSRAGTGEEAAFSVVHVGFVAPLALDDGRSVDPEVGLVGSFDGDGTYEVPAGLGPPPSTGPTAPPEAIQGTAGVSVAGITVIDAAHTAARFGYTLEPCTLVIEADVSVFRATCPALVASDGSQVAMTFTAEPA